MQISFYGSWNNHSTRRVNPFTSALLNLAFKHTQVLYVQNYSVYVQNHIQLSSPPVPADRLVSLGARASAGTVMTNFVSCIHPAPAPRFNIKMSSCQYRKSHCGDKTVVRSSYLHNEISYTGKMASLYWFRPQHIMSTYTEVRFSTYRYPKHLF